MPLGSFVRNLLGPLERPAAVAYRSLFINLQSLVRQIQSWIPDSETLRILEVGCGEGMLIERLAGAYPKARITGIDITDRVGRLFTGNADRVIFRKQTINEFAAENPCSIDLLVMSDVLHHIPKAMHKEILTLAKSALKPGGSIVIKDWAPDATPIHLVCFLMDRYVTGDRVVFRTTSEYRELLTNVLGMECIKDEAGIGPWKNNVVFLARSS